MLAYSSVTPYWNRVLFMSVSETWQRAYPEAANPDYWFIHNGDLGVAYNLDTGKFISHADVKEKEQGVLDAISKL